MVYYFFCIVLCVHCFLNQSRESFRELRGGPLDLIDEVTKVLDEEMYAVSIFLDLSTAFDTVSQSILLSKLGLGLTRLP